MQLKVCGLREPANIRAICHEVQPDYIGLIFYPKSPRFVNIASAPAIVAASDTTPRVGVFVNADIATIQEHARAFALSYIQLHGDEPPEMCARLRAEGLGVIKAIAVSDNIRGEICDDGNDSDQIAQTDHIKRQIAAYNPVADRLLFDRKTKGYGGSGQTFDWGILADFSALPALLSGGIDPENFAAARAFAHRQGWLGLDINSLFETAPGVKDIARINKAVLGA